MSDKIATITIAPGSDLERLFGQHGPTQFKFNHDAFIITQFGQAQDGNEISIRGADWVSHLNNETLPVESPEGLILLNSLVDTLD